MTLNKLEELRQGMRKGYELVSSNLFKLYFVGSSAKFPEHRTNFATDKTCGYDFLFFPEDVEMNGRDNYENTNKK
jgi:hypothetical protein